MGTRFRNLGALLLVLGGLLGKPGAQALGAFLLGVVAVSWALSRLSLDGVTYHRHVSRKAAFPGDKVTLTIRVANEKPLGVSLVCEDEVPGAWETELGRVQGHVKPGRARLKNEMRLLGFETLERRFTVTCRDRGVVAIGPLVLSSGDPFCLYPSRGQDESVDKITVFPRVVPIGGSAAAALHPQGTRRGPSWIVEDPSMLKLVREYAPGDSSRRMDWKASARTGRLHTKVFDATFGNKVVICLDLSTSRKIWEGCDRDAFESLVVAAGSLASHLNRLGCQVGFTSNGITRYGATSGLAQCPPAVGDHQLHKMLSQLSGLGYYSFGSLLYATRRDWVTGAGAVPVVVTALLDQETIETVVQLRRRCPKATLVYLGPKTPGSRTILSQVDEIKNVTVLLGELQGGWESAERLDLSALA